MLVLMGNDLTPSFQSEFNRWAAENTWADLHPLPAKISTYPSGEPYVRLFPDTPADKFADQLAELNGQPVALVQSTAPPVSEHTMQLILAARTLKRYGAGPITAIIPFAAFGRQDRSMSGQFNSVAADDFPHMLREAGISRVITAEVHSQAAEKAYTDVFGIHNVSFVSMAELFARDVLRHAGDLNDIAIGAPDGGNKKGDSATLRAEALNEAVSRLGGRDTLCEKFAVSKTRTGVSKTKIDKFEGSVATKVCVMVDDMTDSGGTICNGATAVKEQGAWSSWAYLTHCLADQNALQSMLTRTIEGAYGTEPLIDRLITTDTVPAVTRYVNDLADNSDYWDVLRKRLTVVHTAETFARRLVLMNT